jgi:hypothetical protein
MADNRLSSTYDDKYPDPPLANRYWVFVTTSIVLFAVALRLYLMWTTQRTAEDFYITLRYAENLARGLGFVFNPGEHVLGTTTPLYALFLAINARLGLDPIASGKLFNIAADGVSVWLIVRLGRAAGQFGAGLVAAGLFAVWPSSLHYSISGMESSCAALASLAVFASLAERRGVALALSSAVLVLLRIDGILAVVVAFAAFGFQHWKRSEKWDPVRVISLFALIIAPWLLFSTLYFGSSVPTSFTAKLSVWGWMNRGALPNLAPFVRQMTHGPLQIVTLLCALTGIWRTIIKLPLLRPAAIWMLAYFGGMAFSKSFLFGWYYVPPAPVYALLAAIGGEWLVYRVCIGVWRGALKPKETQDITPRVAELTHCHLVVLIAILVISLAAMPRIREIIKADQRDEEEIFKPVGLALREIVHPGETVMLEPIGYIGYFSGARILDAVGLVSPQVIRYYRPGAISPYLDIMAELKPEYVLLRAGEYAVALSARVPPERALTAHYVLLRTFPDATSIPGQSPNFYLMRRTGSALPDSRLGG